MIHISQNGCLEIACSFVPQFLKPKNVMKIKYLISSMVALYFVVLGQAEPYKADFTKPAMDGWTSTPTSKKISYSQKRYISGGGGGISGGGGGGKWVTDWQKSKTVTSNSFRSISSNVARIDTIKPFATATTTHMSDWSLDTSFASPKLDLTIHDNDELKFEYRHQAGFQVVLFYSSNAGKNWKPLNNIVLTESALFKSMKVNLENKKQTDEFMVKFVVTDKAGRAIGNSSDFLEIKKITTPPYYDPYHRMSLQMAVFKGDIELTKTLLSRGKDPNEYKYGHTALHVAAFHGNVDVATELVKAGAKVNAQLNPKGINDVEVKQYTVREGDNFVSIAKDHNLMHPTYGPVQFLLLNSIWLKGTALKNNPPTFVVGEDVTVIDANTGPEWFRHTRALKDDDGKLGNPLGFSPELGRVLPLTPLELACVSSKVKMVTWLIQNGANPDGAPGIHNGLWSALGDSFPSEATRNEAVLRALIDGGANLNIERAKGDTPFRVVCTRGLPYYAKILIKAGANYNFKEKSLGKTSLRAAAHFGRAEMVQLLIDKGLDPDARDDWGWTPLHVAINPETVKVLLDGGADIHAKAKDGNEAIHSLIGENMLDSVKYLLLLGVDVDTKGKDNMTPLLQAVKFNHVDGVQLLIDKGAEVKAADDHGMTCLHFARSDAMVEYLISKGANVNAGAKDNTTPLHYASNGAIASLLIENKANLRTKDLDGATPLHWAASSRADVATVLVLAGAPINSRDASGSTPLDYTNDETKNFLIKKGAKLGSLLVSLEFDLAKSQLMIRGVAGATYEIQYSADLGNWHTLESVKLKDTTFTYIDKTTPVLTKRFYRLKN